VKSIPPSTTGNNFLKLPKTISEEEKSKLDRKECVISLTVKIPDSFEDFIKFSS